VGGVEGDSLLSRGEMAESGNDTGGSGAMVGISVRTLVGNGTGGCVAGEKVERSSGRFRECCGERLRGCFGRRLGIAYCLCFEVAYLKLI